MFEDTIERVGQFLQLAIVIAQQLPRDILDSREKTQRLIDAPGVWGPRLRLTFGEEGLPAQSPKSEIVEEVRTQPAVPAYPAVGEVFELTLDGDAPENQPLQIVKDCGYTGKWRHNGCTVKGKQTRRFKLAQAGYQLNLDGVKAALPASGSVEGQWIKAFKAAYPQPDGNGPIGIADASWANPNSLADFPIVLSVGDLSFRWTAFGHVASWRWLVPAE